MLAALRMLAAPPTSSMAAEAQVDHSQTEAVRTIDALKHEVLDQLKADQSKTKQEKNEIMGWCESPPRIHSPT